MSTVSWVNFGLSVLRNAIQGHCRRVQAAGEEALYVTTLERSPAVVGGPRLPRTSMTENSQEFTERFP